MRYISTRGGGDPVDFTTACLSGLAPDGGLYVPQSWPSIGPAAPDETYIDVATRVLSAFAGETIVEKDMRAMCERAYASFAHKSVAPLVQIGPHQWMLELHHGPTLAFKDVAMQLIAQLYDYALGLKGGRKSVVCATSGDTGGAAAAAFAGSAYVDLTILHPHGRISPVQRKYMTTTGAANVQNLALDGDFDDCQAIVKQMFADKEFAGPVGLSGVNSINWARIAAQSVYYATAQAALGPKRALRFIVPSGNMGDALAGYVAARCGMLAGLEIVCAVNANDALAEIFETGIMRRKTALATPSPAMDISVPSNFERLMFEAAGRDARIVRAAYESYAQNGEASLPNTVRGPLGCMGLKAASVSNADTLEEMRRFAGETEWEICPHTAVGAALMRGLPKNGSADVLLATAHAAKFPETVEEALTHAPVTPRRASDILLREEVFERLPADIMKVRDAIEAHRA